MFATMFGKHRRKKKKKKEKDFARRRSKGVKYFQFTVDDRVLQRVMKNVGHKRGKMEPLWTGPYR